MTEDEFQPNYQHCPICLEMEQNAVEWRFTEWLAPVLKNNRGTNDWRWILTIVWFTSKFSKMQRNKGMLSGWPQFWWKWRYEWPKMNSDQIFNIVQFASKWSEMQWNEGMLSGWPQFWRITEVWMIEDDFRPNFQHCLICLKMEQNAAEWKYAEWLATVLKNNGGMNDQRWILTKFSTLSDLPQNGAKCSGMKVCWVVDPSFEEWQRYDMTEDEFQPNFQHIPIRLKMEQNAVEQRYTEWLASFEEWRRYEWPKMNSDQIFNIVQFALKWSKMQRNESTLSGWLQFWRMMEAWMIKDEFQPNFQHCPICLEME